MFETSSARRARQKFHPLTFTISIALHAAAIAFVTFVTIWDVKIPAKAPDQIVAFQVAAGPPPPMISKGRRDAPRERAVPDKPVENRTIDTAPVKIPDLIAPLDTEIAPVDGNGGIDESSGDPGGEIGGDPKGEISGIDNGQGSSGLEPIYGTEEGVRPPVIVRRVEPRYPPLLERLGRPGAVQLQCVISKRGALTDIRVIHSSHPLFAESAIAAVKQWKFLPGQFDGRAVTTRFDFTVTFNVQR